MECSICDNDFVDNRTAKILPACGHTYCEECIKRLCTKGRYKKIVNCPTCRLDSKWNIGDDLHKNFALIELIDELRKSKGHPSTSCNCEHASNKKLEATLLVRYNQKVTEHKEIKTTILDKNDELTAENASLREKNDQLEAELSPLRRKSESAERVKSENINLNTKLKQAKETNANLSSQYELVKGVQIEEVMAENLRLLNTLEKTQSDLIDSANTNNAQLLQLEDTKKALQIATAEIGTMKQQGTHDNLTREKMNFMEMVAIATDDFERRQKKLTELNDQIKMDIEVLKKARNEHEIMRANIEPDVAVALSKLDEVKRITYVKMATQFEAIAISLRHEFSMSPQTKAQQEQMFPELRNMQEVFNNKLELAKCEVQNLAEENVKLRDELNKIKKYNDMIAIILIVIIILWLVFLVYGALAK